MAGDHKCPVCNATFTRPQHVARHMRSHTGDRPYKCQHCGDQFARSDLLSRHVNKCHSAEKPTSALNNRRKGSTSATRATTSKQACDQCVITNLPCDGSNPCSKCISRKCRCTFVKFHRQTAPIGPGHPAPPLPNDKQLNHNQTFSLDHILPSEEYLLNNPSNASITLPGLSGVPIYHHSSAASTTVPPQSDFSFSANSLYPSSDLHPSDSNYSARYRAQAELLYRTGLINNPSQQSPMTTHPQPARYNPNADPIPTTNHPNPSHDHTRFSLSTATWGASTARQDRLDHNNFAYHVNNDNRPHSQHGYPLSIPQKFSAPSDPYDFRYNRHDSIDDSDSASVSASEFGHSSDHSSFYDSPTIPQGISDNPSTHADTRKSDNPERFSSAFGLMSLDDPNVVAGITSDGTPFFSNHNGESIVGEDVLMNLGKVNVPDQMSSASGGITAAGMTPREAEFRDLREFWKQYIRTPLTGPNSNNASFPLATPTPNNVHGQLEAPKPTSGKKLARVASLPSVKTPPVASDVGPIGHHYYASNEARNNNSTNPTSAHSHRSHLHSHMGPDDLQSYERAVLARKTNINLNLPRKRHGTTSGAFYRGRADDPIIPTSLSATSSVPPIVQRRPSSSATEIRAPSTSSESDGGDGNARPSFKRLPSTTLEPTYSKRALLSIPNGSEDYAESNNSPAGNSQSNAGSTTESHNSYSIHDRHRRMSMT
ncbi:hypothetical protein BDM02DRAFT_1496467 [Thelephora ganbajun]|uniref:Uncharacterized protein n=1 Tax=Thelephora ganbajun TaxID=370292 RepID=A0ACB6ZL07_THEGA|nr:hypothetical protein BDM02DRAFT_1496467 [Thelephora ganbajun]